MFRKYGKKLGRIQLHVGYNATLYIIGNKKGSQKIYDGERSGKKDETGRRGVLKTLCDQAEHFHIFST